MKLRQNTRRISVEAVLLLLLSIAVFMPWGCGKAPVAPDYSGRTFELPNGVVAHPGNLLDETGQTDPRLSLPGGGGTVNLEGSVLLESFQKDMDTSGDVIAMDLDGEMSYFSVLPDALTEKTTISVDVWRDANAVDRRITQFDFRPDGLVFETPALLSYHSCEKDGTRLLLFWFDPRDEIWIESAEAVVVDGYATFPIKHFSCFRTTERISLGGQQQAD